MSLLFPKHKTIRDPKWLEHVRTMPCVITGRQDGVVAAHIRWKSDGGTALKPSDNRVVPLTDRMHKFQHQIGEFAFWKWAADRYPEFLKRIAPDFETIFAPGAPPAGASPVRVQEAIMDTVIAHAERQYALFQKNGAPAWL